MPTWLRVPAFLRSRKARIQEVDRNFRQKMLAVMPEDVFYVSCDPSDCPGLNLSDLEDVTSKIKQLGFEYCIDRRSRWPKEQKLRGFQRVFINQIDSCFAVVTSTSKRLESEGELLIGFYCPLEQDWWIGATNGKPSTLKYLIRSPKFAQVVKPSATAAALYAGCVELRNRISSDLELCQAKNVTLEMLDEWSRSHLKEVRSLVERRSAVQAAAAAKKVFAAGEWVWLGDSSKCDASERE